MRSSSGRAIAGVQRRCDRRIDSKRMTALLCLYLVQFCAYRRRPRGRQLPRRNCCGLDVTPWGDVAREPAQPAHLPNRPGSWLRRPHRAHDGRLAGDVASPRRSGSRSRGARMDHRRRSPLTSPRRCQPPCHKNGGDRGRIAARRRRRVRRAQLDGPPTHSLVQHHPHVAGTTFRALGECAGTRRPRGLTSRHTAPCPRRPTRSSGCPTPGSRGSGRAPCTGGWRGNGGGVLRAWVRPWGLPPKTSAGQSQFGRATPTSWYHRNGATSSPAGSQTPGSWQGQGEGHFLGYVHQGEILAGLRRLTHLARATVPCAVECAPPRPRQTGVDVDERRRGARPVRLREQLGARASADAIGAANFITPEVRVRAASLVREGRSIWCATHRPRRGGAAVSMPRRYMVMTGEGLDDEHRVERVPGEGSHPRLNPAIEYIGLVYHGGLTTHIDALSHMFWDGKMYNGIAAESVNATSGATTGTMTDLPNGMLAVALRHPGCPRRRMARAGRRCHARGSGGGRGGARHPRRGGRRCPSCTRATRSREAVHGKAALMEGRWCGPQAGWASSCLPWLHETAGVAAIGHDSGQDQILSGHDDVGLGVPIHVIGLVAMGLWLIDDSDLEELVEHVSGLSGRSSCSARTVALVGSTGSPANPITTF